MMTLEEAHEWSLSLAPGAGRALFDRLPNVLYFAKDRELRLMAGNKGFVARCGKTSETEIIGLTDLELFPLELAEKYRQDDLHLLATGKPISGIVELFPDHLGEPEWFVTDKVPLYDRHGRIAGLCGMVRSYEGARIELQGYLDLRGITQYLKENYAEQISNDDLARIAGLSTRHLERRFRETFKTSIHQYLIRLRVLKSCDFLANSAMSVTEIAIHVGFYDHSAFSRRFREMVGVSPAEYRKRLRNS